MADFKTEASAAYYATKVDGAILLARNDMMKLLGPGGSSGPKLKAVLEEFYGYVAAWDDAKASAAPEQLEKLAESILANLQVYVARAQTAKAADDTAALLDANKPKPPASAPAPAKPAAPSAPTGPAAAAAAPPPPSPPVGEPPAVKKAGMSTDTMLLVAAAGLGAAALLYGSRKR